MSISQDIKNNLKRGEKVAGTAFWLESFIVIGKVIIGLLSGSVVLISDSIHSASDILSIATSWLGLKIAQRKSSEKFAYGFYKAESLGTLLISFLILFGFWQMFTRGLGAVTSFSTVTIPLFALGIALLDAVILFFFGKYEIKIGEEIKSQSLIAMGKENRTHIFSSGVVFIGILAAYYKIPYVEGLFTIGISLLILKIGLSAFKNSVFTLMDVSPDEEIGKKVTGIIEAIPGVEDCFDLRLREAGLSIFGETKIGVRKLIDVERAHEITDLIEEKIRSEIPQIESFVVHVEPFKSNFCHLVLPIKEGSGLNSQLSESFSRSPYFLFVNIKGKEVKGHYVLANPYKSKETKVGLSVLKLINNQKADAIVTPEIGEISFYSLRESLIDVYKCENKSAISVIEDFTSRNLKKIDRSLVKEQL